MHHPHSWIGCAISVPNSLSSWTDRQPPAISSRVASPSPIRLESACGSPIWTINGIAYIPIRSIITDAVIYGSTGILLAHNHPSDDTRPSRWDRIATRRLSQVAEAIDCRLIDHLILGGTSFTSFRELGLL